MKKLKPYYTNYPFHLPGTYYWFNKELRDRAEKPKTGNISSRIFSLLTSGEVEGVSSRKYKTELDAIQDYDQAESQANGVLK